MRRTRTRRHLKVVPFERKKPPIWLSLVVQPVRVLLAGLNFGAGALVLTSQLLLRLIYGFFFVVGLIYLVLATVFAGLGGKPPHDYWQSVWHAESFFGLLILAGILLDMATFAILFFVSYICQSAEDALPE